MEGIKDARKRLFSLGFGIMSFITIHHWLILLKIIIIGMQLPFLFMYSDFIDEDTKASGSLFEISLGNLGFASSLCTDTTLASGKLLLECNTGLISELHDFGIVPDNAVNLDPCTNNNETIQCLDSIPRSTVRTYIEETCVGKK